MHRRRQILTETVDLRASRDELEQRVRERTTSLEQARALIQAEHHRFQKALDQLPAYLVLLRPDYHVPFANRFFGDRYGKNDGRIRLVVRDEGAGFPVSRKGKRRTDEASFGLFSIEQRLAHLGGEMEIDSAPGKGTKITLTVRAGELRRSGNEPGEVSSGAENTGGVAGREKTAVHRVLIVADHQIMREGLVGLMRFEPDIEVVGEAADASQAIELAAQLQPDAIVLDVNLGETSGVEATRAILARNPQVRIIGLSMYADPDVAAAMHAAGAVAYLTKGGPSEELAMTIRACCS